MTGGGLHGRDMTDDAFYERLLSDHSGARAERDRRRAATYQADIDRAAAVRAWADKINAQPGAPHFLRDLAASMGLQADQAAARGGARHAEPDEAYVVRLRAQHETSMQVSGLPGSWDNRYPLDRARRRRLPVTTRTWDSLAGTGGRRMIPAVSSRREADRTSCQRMSAVWR